MAQTFAVANDNPILGMMNFMQFWFGAFLFCGLFIAINFIVWPFKLFAYIMPYRYAIRSITYNEFIDRKFSGASLCDPNTDTNCISMPGRRGPEEGWTCGNSNAECFGKEGWQVLYTLSNNFNIMRTKDSTWSDIGIIVLIAIVLKLFYVMIMNYKSQAASKVIEYKS
jgi:hypothetical protein